MLANFRVLLQIAFRNLFASRLKTAIVGGIVFFGALLLTVGASLLHSVTDGMSRSIIGTLAGDVQVYSAKSKDDLSLFGNMGGEPDLQQIDQFEKLKKTLEAIPNVARVVPMGISSALVTSGNTIDVVLEKLRDAVRKKLAGDASPAVEEQIRAQSQHVQQIVTVLQSEQKNRDAIIDKTKLTKDDADNAKNLLRAADPAFWAGFEKNPLDSLEFLENKIAPQSADADMLYLRYVGTDMAAFRKSFDRFRIVDGQPIPEGRRGFLFSKFFYEDRVKLHAARRLDKMLEAIDEKGETLSDHDTFDPRYYDGPKALRELLRRVAGLKLFTRRGDPDLQRMMHENAKQTREIVLQLDGPQTAKMIGLLQGELHSTEPNLEKLLADFFTMDDANFHERYHFFYDRLAPLLDLYRIRVGDTLTIKAFTKTGYTRSVNLKVYGTFEFTGLDKSPLAGAANLMDIVSFRDLYGFLTADSLKEIQKIEQAAGEKDVDRAQAENELFGADSGGEVVQEKQQGFDKETPDAVESAEKLHREDVSQLPYDPADLEKGVVLNAAVILKDHRLVKQTMADIEAAGKAAGLNLKAVSWRDAAGLIGKLVLVFQVALLIAMIVVLLVALVIISNALVMATLERVREIGTLRAVGAQRTFILGMLNVEGAVIGLFFGALGAAAGGLIVLYMHWQGIPASSDVLNFFFSGPRLRPVLGLGDAALAVGIVFVVATVSSLYPAWLAMRITPRQAMASEE
ncbi:MAG TPA: FtsX-like permease family protein [Myxococcales bacterium]|nr:FtsX-like permease family protein [Myxococcales bacterium]